MLEITKLIKGITETGSVTKVVPVEEDVEKLAMTLNRIFGGEPRTTSTGATVAPPPGGAPLPSSAVGSSGAPYIEALPEKGAIAIHGTSEQVKRVMDALNVLTGKDAASTGIGSGEPSKMRVITLDSKTSAASLADALEGMLKQMRKNPVN